MTVLQSPLCLYSSMYILREKEKKKQTYTTGHFGTINSYNGTPVLAYRYFDTLVGVFTDELVHNGF